MNSLREAAMAADKAIAAATAAKEAENEALEGVAFALSRHTWVAATKAAHPPSAKWTKADIAEAEAAWKKWFNEFRGLLTADK